MIRPGDFVFCYSNGLAAKIIRFGEWLRFRRGTWNHVAIVHKVEMGRVYVIQAEARGVTDCRTIDEIAPGGHYEVRRLRNVDPEQVVAFARQEVGSKYGWLSIVSTALDLITPLWFVAFRRAFSWICSALAGEAARCGGWLHRWADSYTVTPQALYNAFVADEAVLVTKSGSL